VTEEGGSWIISNESDQRFGTWGKCIIIIEIPNKDTSLESYPCLDTSLERKNYCLWTPLHKFYRQAYKQFWDQNDLAY
jgi:hypothetical protein